MKNYIVTYFKTFHQPIFMATEFDFLLWQTTDKDFAIKIATKYNLENEDFTERFRVWESETKKFNKKKSKVIYE